MGTRCLTTVMDGNKEILCMYRQMDGYLDGHGMDLQRAFQGYKITNGIANDSRRTANGPGCLAAQVVAVFKHADAYHPAGNGCGVGNFYLYAPESREVGEEFVYTLSVRGPDGNGRIWLDVIEGEVAFFGMPGTKPELMEWIYSGWLDDFSPEKCGQMYHANA